MPTRADLEAAAPKCDRACGPASEVRMCGRTMRWFAEVPQTLFRGPVVNGVWVCVKHGPLMDGLEAAQRAGYVMEIVEAA